MTIPEWLQNLLLDSFFTFLSTGARMIICPFKLSHNYHIEGSWLIITYVSVNGSIIGEIYGLSSVPRQVIAWTSDSGLPIGP